ncbi:MAG: lipid-A-disaccharide synthase [Candidatus Anammoxibacter sp.]
MPLHYEVKSKKIIMEKIFISAGEQSGDIHGSNLIREILRKDHSIEISGLGSARMISEGMKCIHDMTKKSVMWLHTVTKIHEFYEILSDSVSFLKAAKPSLVILIDYCGLNFYIARSAKKLGIPVMYYVSPQIWAHGGWRVKKIKKLVDKMVVIFPFEEELYNDADVPVKYFGNPIADELSKIKPDIEYVSRLKNEYGDNIISLLPGSREQEIKKFLPILLNTASLIYNTDKTTRFVVSCSDGRHEDIIASMVKASSILAPIIVNNLAEIIMASKLCLTCSGTVTLKIAYYSTPMVVIYKISALAFFISKPFRQSPYLCLANRLADEFVVPERLMYKNDYNWIYTSAMKLLNNTEVRERCVKDLQKIKRIISSPSLVSERVAEEAINMIN